MKRFLLAVIIATAFAFNAFSWSQKGHDTTVAIAERHLTPSAKAAVGSIFNGRSMVYWANWLDNASHTPEYAYSKTWHYKNVDDGVRYEEAPANPAGDVVTAIKAQMETLSNPASTADEKELALKILIHIVGDMHQPMHMGHATDLGGNRVMVRFFGRDNNLHAVWDGSIVESGHKWSYSEWVDQLDRVPASEVDSIVAGTIDDWAKQSLDIAAKVYERMPADTKISYDEVAEWTPTIEQQLLNGGLRLAHILNILFDKEYASSHAAPYQPAR